MYETVVERGRRVLGGEFVWITDAMSWSVVGGGAVSVDAVARRLGGDPGGLVERGLDFDVEDDSCLWFVEKVGDAVALMEVNGLQASRPEVLRRLSAGSARVHSAFWNIEHDNEFCYAVAGEVVTAFDGEFPDERRGTDPEALEAERAPLWTMVEEHEWNVAMLALSEVRTGVALDESWFARPHLSIVTPWLPDETRPHPA